MVHFLFNALAQLLGIYGLRGKMLCKRPILSIRHTLASSR